jgi:hypothetical protein
MVKGEKMSYIITPLAEDLMEDTINQIVNNIKHYIDIAKGEQETSMAYMCFTKDICFPNEIIAERVQEIYRQKGYYIKYIEEGSWAIRFILQW